MSSSFEQQLKQKLEQSSPEELGYRPDREQLWNRIATQQQSKKLPLRLWISHAAAIAAGLLIGSFFLATYKDREAAQHLQPGHSAATALVTPPVASPNGTVTGNPPGNTVVPAQHAPGLQQPGMHQHQQTTIRQQAPAVAVTTEPVPETTPEVPVQEQPPVIIAHTEQRKPKVLHLMDIDNENTRAMRNPQEQNMTWAWMVPPNQTTAGGTSFSAQVSQHLFNSKN